MVTFLKLFYSPCLKFLASQYTSCRTRSHHIIYAKVHCRKEHHLSRMDHNLIIRQRTNHNIHGATYCINTNNHTVYYFLVRSTHEYDLSTHKTCFLRMLRTLSTTAVANWSMLDHIGQRVAAEDGAIWLCIGIQLTLAGYDIPECWSEYITPGRSYVANCLLDGNCPEVQDLIIFSLKKDTLQIDSIVIYSLTTQDTRKCTSKYSLLVTEYCYTPQDDSPRLSNITGQDNISQRLLSTDERHSISLWLQDKSASHVLHEDLFRGEVTTGDIQALVEPSTLTVGLILHLLFSQFPVGHCFVLILDQSLMEVIRDQKWVSVMQDPSHPAHP